MLPTIGGALRATFLAAALSLGMGSVAHAQAQFPDAKLDSFVDAAIEVDARIAEWSPKIEAAADENAANELREQANADLAAAIEQTEGITIGEYQEIAQAARSDPALSERLKEIYEAKSGG